MKKNKTELEATQYVGSTMGNADQLGSRGRETESTYIRELTWPPVIYPCAQSLIKSVHCFATTQSDGGKTIMMLWKTFRFLASQIVQQIACNTNQRPQMIFPSKFRTCPYICSPAASQRKTWACFTLVAAKYVVYHALFLQQESQAPWSFVWLITRQRTSWRSLLPSINQYVEFRRKTSHDQVVATCDRCQSNEVTSISMSAYVSERSRAQLVPLDVWKPSLKRSTFLLLDRGFPPDFRY